MTHGPEFIRASFYVPRGLHRRLKILAAKTDSTVSNLVTQMLTYCADVAEEDGSAPWSWIAEEAPTETPEV